MLNNRLPKKHIDIFQLMLKCSDPFISNGSRYRASRRYMILENDFFRCVFCKSTEKLTIDHINYSDAYRKTGRFVMEDYRLENCRTLCTKCHIHFTNQKRQSRIGVIQ